MAAIQIEEQVVQLDANARRAVVALVTQSKEDVRLAAVSGTRHHHTVSLCTFTVVCTMLPIGYAVEEKLLRIFLFYFYLYNFLNQEYGQLKEEKGFSKKVSKNSQMPI